MRPGWKTIRLEEIFEIARGGSPRPIEKYLTDDPNGLNWVKIGDATASGKFIKRTKEKIIHAGLSKTRRVRPGDFLLTNSMSFGRPYIMATDGCIHDGWLLLRPSDERFVCRDYFYHLLGSNAIYARLAARAGGSTVKNLNTDIVASIEIPLPPLDEQKRIAAILDKADQLRQKRRQALTLLDNLTRSMFLEMFGEQKSAAWPHATIGQIALDMRTGPFGSQLLHSEFVDEGIAVLGIDNAVNNRFEWGKARFVTPAKYRELSRYTVKPNDILITIMGTCGRCAVVPDNIPTAINTKHLCCITIAQEKVLPYYLHACFLNDRSVLKQLGIQAKGAVMPGLNMGIIRSLVIPIPPLSLQQHFQEILASVTRLIGYTEVVATNAESLFSSLQHRAFTGQL